MEITTRGGNQSIDLTMPSNDKKVIKDNNEFVKVSGKVEDNTRKAAEVPTKVIPMPRPQQPFPQRLVTKAMDDKYGRFITML